MKDLFRIVGTAFILTGIFLYFSFQTDADSQSKSEINTLSEEITRLKGKLQKTEEELAHLQTIRTEAELPEENADSEKTSNNEDATQVQKTILQIEEGTTSKEVSNRLVKTGIIEDADSLNAYLKDNDLEKSIQIGVYEIDKTMSIEEIAHLITTRQ